MCIALDAAAKQLSPELIILGLQFAGRTEYDTPTVRYHLVEGLPVQHVA
jgi:hypothetical protein